MKMMRVMKRKSSVRTTFKKIITDRTLPVINLHRRKVLTISSQVQVRVRTSRMSKS